MSVPDSYKTIDAVSEGIYREKGSKFVAEAYPVEGEDDIKSILTRVKRGHYEARHHCFAYVIGETGDSWRANDDGEPSGTAGKPILGRIKSYGLTNILVVVSRYFGGTLLGVSGLLNAYKTAAESALANAAIIEKSRLRTFEILFPYTQMNSVMKVIKEENLIQESHNFDTECRITVQVKVSSQDRIKLRFSRISGLVIKQVNIAK